jgi:hypothetical protein
VPDIKKISSYLAEALRFGIEGRFVDRRRMLAENVRLAGFQEKAFGHQKISS